MSYTVNKNKQGDGVVVVINGKTFELSVADYRQQQDPMVWVHVQLDTFSIDHPAVDEADMTLHGMADEIDQERYNG